MKLYEKIIATLIILIATIFAKWFNNHTILLPQKDWIILTLGGILLIILWTYEKIF